jgi:hypothetical protein
LNIKIKILAFVFFIILSSFASAQGFYFDVGLGVDYNLTTIIYADEKINNSNFYYMGFNFGFKAGYGPFSDTPIFFVVGYENIYGPIGLGAIFYPIPFIQLGTSIGLTIDMGFAWDTSVAIDFGRSNHGVLIGLKYWGLSQEYTEFGYYGNRMVNNAFGIFVRYVYRIKSNERHELWNLYGQKVSIKDIMNYGFKA